MADEKNLDITTQIAEILSAYYGRDVRQALVDALTATEQAVNDLDQDKIKSGTIEYTLSASSPSVSVPLGLDFTPKQVFANIRQNDSTPTPYKNFCTHVYTYKNVYYVGICMGPSYGQTTVNVPAGNYSIDYIAIV